MTRDIRFPAVLLAGAIGWLGLGWIGLMLAGTHPSSAGFDLEILLRAGREVGAGRSPYDATIVAGRSPMAESLFYSYPPIVAQVMAAVTALPGGIALIVWDGAAVLAFGAVTGALARRLAPAIPPWTARIAAVAAVPWIFPFAVGLLFGNLDVFFPALFGLALLAVLPAGSAAASRREVVLGGAALATATLAKLHPASLGAWLVARPAPAPARSISLTIAGAAALAALAAVGLSVLLGGIGPWLEYASVVRAGSGAAIVDPRNAGPAAQLALLLRGPGPDGEALARVLQVAVSLAAVGVTLAAARRVTDPVTSLAWAAAATLVILPVTWYHYPVALVPFAAASVLRVAGRPQAGRVFALTAGAAAIAILAVAALPALWLAIGLVLAAAHVAAQAPLGDGKDLRVGGLPGSA